jgi:hypothetical protein
VNPEILEALVIASAGMLAIGQTALTLVLLGSAGGLKSAAAYAAGMFGVLLAFGEGALVLGSRLQIQEMGGDWSSATGWFSVVLGMALLVAAIRTWRRPQSPTQRRPRLLELLDSANPLRLLGLGALVGTFNVKNLAAYLTAVDVVVRARLPLTQGSLAVLAVTVVFCSCVLAPIGLRLLGGASAQAPLAALRAALERHHRPLALGMLILFGSAFVARGVHLLGR